MFENIFERLDAILRQDAGCTTELDYIEQSSWMMFLKYLDDYEIEKETTAKLSGQSYSCIISDEYRWKTWAAPKTADGKLDFNATLSGDDLKEFVDNRLFPYFASFKTKAESSL